MGNELRNRAILLASVAVLYGVAFEWIVGLAL